MMVKPICFFLIYIFGTGYTVAQEVNYLKSNYRKLDTLIRMRDGINLYTVIYSPKDQSLSYPFLMERTPYSSGPYGDSAYPKKIANDELMKEKYIFVMQDVRGRYMSEGINLEVTPNIALKKSKKDVDESSDTFDTIEWLLKNIKNNNGRVGIYGISYPGFYATASLPAAHPAIRAVSPQAPVTDEFIGDDVNHNGAFFLMDNFSFMNYFGKPVSGPVKDYGSEIFKYNARDVYKYFLNLGPLKNTQSPALFNHSSYIWDEYLAHDTYDSYWQKRNIRTHLNEVTIPTLVVGGLFDAEDMFGALKTYQALESQSKNNNNRLVMGPWTHGAWASGDWSKFGPLIFGANTSKYFQDSVQNPFFRYYLKDKGNINIAEATIFETGSNSWKNYSTWPPLNVSYKTWYFNAGNELSQNRPIVKGYDEYVSDPSKPVPYTDAISGFRNNEYLVEDQRFAAVRPDVIYYQSQALSNDVELTGKITVDLFVNISSTDADFIVKLIDVYPDSLTGNYNKKPMSGYQQMVRAEVMRGKFRNNYEHPEPFVPGMATRVKFTLNDVAHQFRIGHKIMIQIQSSWFPLVDRNPQTFMHIPEADVKDFQKAQIRIIRNPDEASSVTLPVLNIN